MLISEAFRQYSADVIAFRNQSAKTEENHFVVMKALIIHFGDIEIESLSFRMIRDFKLYLEQGRSPATVRNYIIKIRIVLAYLKKRGVACISPEQVPVPKRVDKVPLFLTKEQVAQCISSTCRLKNKAIISLLYASGIRVSELCSLDRGQFHDCTFTIVGKGGKARLCFIDQRTCTLIDLYLETRLDSNPALFLTDEGKRITPGVIQGTFRSLRCKLGIEVHPHTLRHSFATNLLETNTNLFHVSKMLGHAQLNTTSQYLHIINKDLQRVYNEHHST